MAVFTARGNWFILSFCFTLVMLTREGLDPFPFGDGSGEEDGGGWLVGSLNGHVVGVPSQDFAAEDVRNHLVGLWEGERTFGLLP